VWASSDMFKKLKFKKKKGEEEEASKISGIWIDYDATK